MKKMLILLSASMIISVAACAQIPDWRPRVVLKAAYGDGEKEFLRNDYHDEGEGQGGGIAGFYICSDGIFISDAVRHNVRAFDLAGDYKRTIPIAWQYPYGVRNISLATFVVSEGVMYFLSDMGGPAQHGATRFSVFSFDLETGKQIERIMIHNSTLGYDLNGRPVGNSVRIIVEKEGDISIWDYVRQVSYPLIRNGTPVLEEEQVEGIPGRPFGMYRLQSNRENGGIDILDATGKQTGENCEGSMVIVSRDGNFMLSDILEQTDKESIVSKMIYGNNCRRIARIQIPNGERASRSAFQPNDPFQFGPDGCLYEIFVATDGVLVFRWSN